MKREFAGQYENLEQWHWWFRARQRILETVLRRELRTREFASIISVGCGPARGLSWLIPLAKSRGRVVGLDSDPGHACRLEAPIDYVIGNLQSAPLASGSFDVVLALDVLEHLDDDVAGLREAARLLRPDGLLLLTVPALPSLWGQQDEVSHHRRRYTKRSLSDAFARASLGAPRFSYFNTLLLPPIAAVRWLRRRLLVARNSVSDFDDNRPGLINDALAAIFGLERNMVGRFPLPFGVSLMALWRRPGGAYSDQIN